MASVGPPAYNEGWGRSPQRGPGADPKPRAPKLKNVWGIGHPK